MSSSGDDILTKWIDRACGCRIEYWLNGDNRIKVPLKCKLHGGKREVKLRARDLPKLQRKLNDIQRQISYITLSIEEIEN